MNDKIRVVFFQRKPLPIHKSLEFIFSDVRARMPDYVQCITKVFRFYSKGIFKRLYSIWEAYTHQEDVNHVTGDIHFATILLPRHKTMLTVLDCRMLSETTGIKHLLLKYFWFTLPLKKCQLVTVISDATKVELIKFTNYPESRIKIIPVAISPEFTYMPKSFRKPPVILQVGTTVNKNLDRLMEALKGIDCQLVLIGVLTDAIKLSLVNNNISYRQDQDISHDRLIQYYRECDMISFVSTYEGFGMPIVEANATGRAVITSNILSMPEVAGNAACMVDPYNVEAIRNGIMKIIHDDVYREQLIQNGLENCRRFEPQRIADSYLECYKSLSGKLRDREGN